MAARNPPFPTMLEDHPAAHPNADDFEPDGTVYHMRTFKGDLLVVEPNHGRLLRINVSNWRGPKIEQLTDTSAVVGHVVPTSWQREMTASTSAIWEPSRSSSVHRSFTR